MEPSAYCQKRSRNDGRRLCCCKGQGGAFTGFSSLGLQTFLDSPCMPVNHGCGEMLEAARARRQSGYARTPSIPWRKPSKFSPKASQILVPPAQVHTQDVLVSQALLLMGCTSTLEGFNARSRCWGRAHRCSDSTSDQDPLRCLLLQRQQPPLVVSSQAARQLLGEVLCVASVTRPPT